MQDGKNHLFDFLRVTITEITLLCITYPSFNQLEEPKNMKLDTMRNFFGIKAEQAHEAYSDTIDSAKLLAQFIKFHRRQSSVAKFKGAMSDK